MKLFVLSLFAVALAAPAFANPRCVPAAEAAAYKAWYKKGEFRFGHVLPGTSVVFSRAGITSFQVTIEFKKPDSSVPSYAGYYVRMDDSCRLIRAKKF